MDAKKDKVFQRACSWLQAKRENKSHGIQWTAEKKLEEAIGEAMNADLAARINAIKKNEPTNQ